MASQVQIVNLALTMLGSDRITSIDDPVKPAREAKAIFDMRRDALLAGHNWSFAKARGMLQALSDAPAFQFARQFQLPGNCLRVIMVNDYYVGVDLTNYRGAPSEEYAIEGNTILADWNAPLKVTYIKRVTDTTLFAPLFVTALAADLADALAEPLTASNEKRDRARQDRMKAVSDAIRVNAIEQPPVKLPDDEWLMSRL